MIIFLSQSLIKCWIDWQVKSSTIFLMVIWGAIKFSIACENQEKTNFTCPYGTFSFRRIAFGLCNAPATFQWCMMPILSYLIECSVEVFMDHLSFFRESFRKFLDNFEMMLNVFYLIVNWKKFHFLVKGGIVLGNKVSMREMEMDRTKVEFI